MVNVVGQSLLTPSRGCSRSGSLESKLFGLTSPGWRVAPKKYRWRRLTVVLAARMGSLSVRGVSRTIPLRARRMPVSCASLLRNLRRRRLRTRLGPLVANRRGAEDRRRYLLNQRLLPQEWAMLPRGGPSPLVDARPFVCAVPAWRVRAGASAVLVVRELPIVTSRGGGGGGPGGANKRG